jgi:hypothetical protein
MSSATAPSSTAAPQECITAVPDSNGYVPPSSCNALYSYNPSFAAAVAFTVLFAIVTVAHIVLAILHRKRFCWVLLTGAVWELTSFILRILGTRDQQNEAYITASTLLFLLAPLWINAFVYMTAGRMIYFLHPSKQLWRLKAVKIGRWFVWLDILSFVIQVAGGLMMNQENGQKIMETGKNVYMVGVGVQQIFILIFLALIVRFHMGMLKVERQGQSNGENGRGGGVAHWKWLTYTLYAVLALITVRIIFRLVEFSAGVDGATNHLVGTEGYILGLDAAPMMIALLLLAIIHPGIVLKGPGSELPSRKERKAEKKARKAEKKSRKAGNYLLENTKGGPMVQQEVRVDRAAGHDV